MSALREVTIFCDGPGCGDWDEAGTGRTAKQARAGISDWSTGLAGGHDYCPDCVLVGNFKDDTRPQPGTSAESAVGVLMAAVERSAPADSESVVIDLMAKLEQSVAKAKAARTRHPQPNPEDGEQ